MVTRQFIADLIALAHVAFAQGIVWGLAVMIAGALFGSPRTSSRRIIFPHALAKAFTTFRVALGFPSPLTLLELAVRGSERAPTHFAHGCHRLAFEGTGVTRFDWDVLCIAMLTVAYCVFGIRAARTGGLFRLSPPPPVDTMAALTRPPCASH